MLNIQKEISFSKLLSYTNINKDEINIAIANEIENGNFNFKNILTESKYCSYIFLKNSKFFTVLIDKKYHIRDCHESTQYTFDHVDDLINPCQSEEHLQIAMASNASAELQLCWNHRPGWIHAWYGFMRDRRMPNASHGHREDL